MGERHHIEELLEKSGVVDVAIDDKDSCAFEELLAGAFEAGIVVVIEVIEAEDSVAAALEGDRDVGADEAGSAGDEDGDA